MPKPECPPLFLSSDQKGQLSQFFYKPKNLCPGFSPHLGSSLDAIPCYPIEHKPICYDPLPRSLPPKAAFSPCHQSHDHSKHKSMDCPKPVKFETMYCPKPCLPFVSPKNLVPCFPCPEPAPVPFVVQPAKPEKHAQCPMVCFMPQKKKKVPEYVYQATVTTPKKVANRYISSNGDHYCFMHCEKKTPRKEQSQYYLVKAQDVKAGKPCTGGGPSSHGSCPSVPCVPCLPCDRPREPRPPCPPPSEPVLPWCHSPCMPSQKHAPETFCYIPCPPVFCQNINPF